MNTIELAKEYNEVRSLIYGLSIEDFLRLREQSLKETALASPFVSPTAHPTMDSQRKAPAVQPAPPSTLPVSRGVDTGSRPQPPVADPSPIDNLSILKGLGE